MSSYVRSSGPPNLWMRTAFITCSCWIKLTHRYSVRRSHSPQKTQGNTEEKLPPLRLVCDPVARAEKLRHVEFRASRDDHDEPKFSQAVIRIPIVAVISNNLLCTRRRARAAHSGRRRRGT